jgi:hypothetical protein
LSDLADIEIAVGTANHKVQAKVDVSQSMFKTLRSSRQLSWCDYQQAELKLNEGDILGAKRLFRKCFEYPGQSPEL